MFKEPHEKHGENKTYYISAGCSEEGTSLSSEKTCCEEDGKCLKGEGNRTWNLYLGTDSDEGRKQADKYCLCKLTVFHDL